MNEQKTKDTKIVTFFIGDLVKLKHIEGPFMLVEDLNGNRVTTCWFEGCVLHRGAFNVRNLENHSDT